MALGDSYTIGTGASSSAHSWPAIVGNRLAEQTGREVEVTNPAVNGFTTLDLIDRELPHLARIKPDLVTILIGVNDLVRGRTPGDYQRSLVTIYGEVATLKLPPGRVLAVSIPNWSVVPAAREYGDPEQIRDLTDTFNDVAHEEAEARGFIWVDITAASISGLGSAQWISSDGLHPADPQYAAWAEVIWHSVRPAWL
ncbi:MAG: SGNH/GDSL hydrolase family protein [Candidatus Dormibacteraceae bacterium]